MIKKIKHHAFNSFPAFKHKNYRIFFASQLVSLVGTWMQQVAQGYLAFQLTHSAFWVGAVAASANLPTTFLSLIGGTIVDRFHKKDILRITQGLQFLIATTLGIVVMTGHINLYSLMGFAFLLGLVNSVDQPARISIITQLVDKDDIHSATAMNMSMFNSARIVGPAIAGLLIAGFGIGWAFLLNGISFLAPFLAFNFINFAPFVKKPHLGTLHAIKEGLHYATTHPIIKFFLVYLAVVSIFGFAYVTILPVVAIQVFHLNASGLGSLYSAAGAGSVIGALVMSSYARKFPVSNLILVGGILYSVSLIFFSFSPSLILAMVALFIVGFGLTTQNSTIQATIQKHVEDRFRGRVASIQTLVNAGFAPIGSFQIGLMAEHIGSQMAIRIGAVIVLVAAIVLFIKRPKID